MTYSGGRKVEEQWHASTRTQRRQVPDTRPAHHAHSLHMAKVGAWSLLLVPWGWGLRAGNPGLSFDTTESAQIAALSTCRTRDHVSIKATNNGIRT